MENLPVCRDYLRNDCRRGERCKYFHPEPEKGKEAYVFCHDFQNGVCNRFDCRFVHCTSEEEAFYYKSGYLLPHVYEAYCQKMERFRNENYNSSENADVANYTDNFDGRCVCKKRRIFTSENSNTTHLDSRDKRAIWMLESENEILHKRLAEYKKRIDDLQAANEFLLEQNARFRNGDSNPLTPSTTVNLSAVGISNVTSSVRAESHHMEGILPTPGVSTIQTMATVPVSLSAAVATTPVSISAVSMASVHLPPAVVCMAQVQMPPAVVSMAQMQMPHPAVTMARVHIPSSAVSVSPMQMPPVAVSIAPVQMPSAAVTMAQVQMPPTAVTMAPASVSMAQVQIPPVAASIAQVQMPSGAVSMTRVQVPPATVAMAQATAINASNEAHPLAISYPLLN